MNIQQMFLMITTLKGQKEMNETINAVPKSHAN